MKNIFKFIGVAASLILSSTTTHAAMVIGADTVSTNGVVEDVFGPLENLINQGGLTQTYQSGVTDFDQFTANTSGFTGNFSQALTGIETPFGSYVEFGFDNAVQIEGIAVWNQSGSASLRNFDLIASANGSFSDAVALGSFEMLTQGGLANVFSFQNTLASAIRLVIQNNFGFSNSTRFDEVAFNGGGAQISAVPVPAALPLLATGLAGLGLMGWRKRKTGKV